MNDARLVIGLEGAGVGPLVGYLHLVNMNGEVTVVAIDQRHTPIQRPLICPREKDIRAVQPGLVGHLLVNTASAGKTGSN